MPIPLERPASLGGERSFLRRTGERCAGAASIFVLGYLSGVGPLWGAVGALGLLFLLTAIDLVRQWLWNRRVQRTLGPQSTAALRSEGDPRRTVSALIALQNLSEAEPSNDTREPAPNEAAEHSK